MGIFSGLEAFGFKNTNMQVYEKKEKQEQKEQPNRGEEQKEEAKEPAIIEKDLLFSKTFQCPVCDKSFHSLAVRAGKVRNIGHDEDLRPLYKEIDPIKYDAIVCPHCGYGALSRYFSTMMPLQGKRLRAEVKEQFRGMDVSTDFYSYDEAIMRYKMVLMCDVVGGVKKSRKAYTCLKLGWVIRGKLQAEAAELSAAECEKLRAEEKECIQNAYDGYVMAFSSENFPMSGMDEYTVTYLVAQLAFRLGKYRESVKLLSRLLGNNSVPARIKDQALTLKEEIRCIIQPEKENN